MNVRGKSLLQEQIRIRVFKNVQGNLPQKNSDINDDDSKWPHNYRISRANVPHLERVFSNLRQQLKRKPEDEKEDLDVNTLIWWMFMTVTYHSTKNQPQRAVKQWFDVTRKLVRDQTEIQGTSMINGQEKSWKRTTLLSDRAVRLSTAKSYVFSDSVLCMGRISDNPVSAWKEETDRFMNSSQCRELDRIDGEPMELEWKIFQASLICRFSPRSRKWWLKIQCELEQFLGRIIFMSMYNDIVCWEKGNEDLCIANAEDARTFAHGHLSFLGPGSETKWYGTHTYKPNGKWDRVAKDMMLNFSEVDVPYSLDPVLWSQGKGKLSLHFCGVDDTAELVLRTIISVNQLSIYGAVADMCDEVACRISGCSEVSGKFLLLRDHDDANRTVDSEQNGSDHDKVQGNLLHDYEHQFANLPDNHQLFKLCSNVGITKTVAKGQYFTTFDDAEPDKLVGAHVESTFHFETTQHPK